MNEAPGTCHNRNTLQTPQGSSPQQNREAELPLLHSLVESILTSGPPKTADCENSGMSRLDTAEEILFFAHCDLKVVHFPSPGGSREQSWDQDCSWALVFQSRHYFFSVSPRAVQMLNLCLFHQCTWEVRRMLNFTTNVGEQFSLGDLNIVDLTNNFMLTMQALCHWTIFPAKGKFYFKFYPCMS